MNYDEFNMNSMSNTCGIQNTFLPSLPARPKNLAKVILSIVVTGVGVKSLAGVTDFRPNVARKV